MWDNYSEAFAFLGNSLLSPMNQTSKAALNPAFWDAFPSFGNTNVRFALEQCGTWAQTMQDHADPALRASAEYTQLFIGPPKPAAPPWESFYRSDDIDFGFGEATFKMQQLLREENLVVNNDNNQYADHIGIELLYLSILCQQARTGNDKAGDQARRFAGTIAEWINPLHQRVAQSAPGGYFECILGLTEALLHNLKA